MGGWRWEEGWEGEGEGEVGGAVGSRPLSVSLLLSSPLSLHHEALGRWVAALPYSSQVEARGPAREAEGHEGHGVAEAWLCGCRQLGGGQSGGMHVAVQPMQRAEERVQSSQDSNAQVQGSSVR